MKKGQMEIMGLAIVMILISMGILFVLKFSIQSRQVDLKTEYTESQLSANLLNSLLQMTTDCNNKQVKTLFSECSVSNQIDCGSGLNSCEYLNDTIGEILNKTLIRWNKRFYFQATNTQNLQTGGMVFGSPCQGGKDTNEYPIQAGARIVIVSLDICRQEK